MKGVSPDKITTAQNQKNVRSKAFFYSMTKSVVMYFQNVFGNNQFLFTKKKKEKKKND